MFYLQMWQIVVMSLILLACTGLLLYVIFNPAVEFKDDIEFKPANRESAHVSNDSNN